MLTICALKNFYFLPHFHDMRYGYARIMEIIRMNYHRDPYTGDVFFFMSKNERSVRMLLYEKYSFNVHTRTFSKGCRFMKLRVEDNKSVYRVDWKDVVSILESPVVKEVVLKERV